MLQASLSDFKPAEQMDVHEGTSTVREAMRFSAYLRQPASVPIAEKDDYVEQMLDLLELQGLAEALVSSLSMSSLMRCSAAPERATRRC